MGDADCYTGPHLDYSTRDGEVMPLVTAFYRAQQSECWKVRLNYVDVCVFMFACFGIAIAETDS